MSLLPDPRALVPRVIELCLAAAEPVEFDTYLLGVRADRTLASVPAEIAHEWKGQIKRAVGQAIGDLWYPRRAPAFERPQLLMIYDYDRDAIERRIRRVTLYGRYRKLERGLPQTEARWRCTSCDGRGCEACSGSGRRYQDSVEELIGRPAAEAFAAEGFQLHGMGREDIDVLCLGNGRPFVLELQTPLRRSTDLDALTKAIESDERVALPVGLRAAPEATIPRVKGCRAAKVYRAVCEPTQVGDSFEPKAVMALSEALTGVTLEQRTPVRVSRRRADKIRRRRVESFDTSQVTERRFVALLRAESGTYIKELISGDEGRTVPSVASLLGVPCECSQLDVLGILINDSELVGPPDVP